MNRSLEQLGLNGPDGRTPPLVARIAKELVRDILTGNFMPGDRIREQALADRFSASRAPVREAIRLLEIDGLVVTEPWRGARVVSLTTDEVDDLFELLSALFGLVAKLATRHGSESQIESFAAAVERMAEGLEEEAPTFDRVMRAFDAAHVLRQMAGPSRASEMLFRTSRLAFLNHRIVQEADHAWQSYAIAMWRSLVAVVAARDDEGAESIARRIVRFTQDYTISRLREEQAVMVKRRNVRKRSPAS